MSNRLLINPGTPQAWQIELNPGLNRIGRGESNDFVINHPSISTHHCEITVTDTTVTVRDLGSTNGTFVERVPINVFQLHNGQHVQFGSVDMMFDTDMSPVLPSPAVNMPGAGARIVLANPGASAPPPPPPVGGLKINRAAQAAPPPPPVAPPPGPRSSNPIAARSLIQSAAAAEAGGDHRLNIRGVCGAVLGGFLGMLVWYFLISATESSWGIVAWGVGVVTGFGGRLLGKNPSLPLGIVCGACALAAILFGEYFGIRALVAKEVSSLATMTYRIEMESAREAIKLETPEQIRTYISEDKEVQASEVTEEQIKKFQEEDIPKMRALLDGKPSKAEFVNNLKSKVADEFNYKEYFFKDDVKSGIFMLVFTVLGVGTAYKIGVGDED